MYILLLHISCLQTESNFIYVLMLLLILPSQLNICEGLFNEPITFRFPETI